MYGANKTQLKTYSLPKFNVSKNMCLYIINSNLFALTLYLCECFSNNKVFYACLSKAQI